MYGGEIKIILPQITYREIQERIKKKLKEVKPIYKKIYNDCRVLRNSDEYKRIFASNDVNIDLVYSDISDKFEHMLKEGNVEIIPYPTVDVTKIFENYFTNKPPFKEGEKKHEFPDAFAIETVEQWCIKKKKKSYVLCKDKDILDFDKGYLIPIKDFKTYINQKVVELQKVEKHQEKLQLIETTYQLNKDLIENELESQLEDTLQDYFKYDYNNNLSLDVIEFLTINITNISDYSINFVRENDADIEVEFDVDIEAEVIYDDYSSASYDKEDDVWHFVDVTKEQINRKLTLSASIIVEFNPPSGKDFAFLKLKSINNDRKFRL